MCACVCVCVCVHVVAVHARVYAICMEILYIVRHQVILQQIDISYYRYSDISVVYILCKVRRYVMLIVCINPRVPFILSRCTVFILSRCTVFILSKMCH